MPLPSLLRWILPREDHFYVILERQAGVVHQASAVLGLLRQGRSAIEVRSTLEEREREGDLVVKDMVAALGRTFVTPIDREDLQRISRKLDDVLDYMSVAARACVLFAVEKPTGPMLDLVAKLEEASLVLVQTMPLLRQHRYADLIDACGRVSELERQGDTIHRDALSALFHDPAVDAKQILREREVLEDLEKALDRCNQVADTLTDVAVKHA